MQNVLDRILASKREEVRDARVRVPEAELRARCRDAAPPRAFEDALRERLAAGKPSVIAEFKRASPSQGVMKQDVDPAAIARQYEAAGAACLSVLTDGPFFNGSPADLKAARAACQMPVLRKDFLVDAYQVWEARAMGADCVLLIAGATPLALMQDMAALASELGMSALIESHRGSELADALQVASRLVGINNRDLATFETDLNVCIELSRQVPPDRVVIAESGISTAADVGRLRRAGIHAFLAGGALMSSPDPADAFRRIFASEVL
jgi:indole-3-glycerol phosphate synthase